jgi:hypothetical protein
MLSKIGGIKEMFGPKDKHPMADARELRRVLGEVDGPLPFKALDEIVSWLESMLAADEFAVDALFDATRQFDEVAQVHLRKLSRDYLLSPRLSRIDEKRLWTISHGFWRTLAMLYERCLELAMQKGRAAESVNGQLPLLLVRLLAALGGELKWSQFHYGPCPGLLWLRLGRAMSSAENLKLATRSVQIYPQGAITSPQSEYLRVLALHAASMDSLLPLEIDLAERFIAHFLPGFVFGTEEVHDNVYWVDLNRPQPPLRLARMPEEVTPSLRFFKPGQGHAQIESLIRDLEMGGDMPPEINLGGQYPVKALLPVLRHLAAYLAPIPPQRNSIRHCVKHRMSVLNGLVNAFVVFSGDFGGRPAGLQTESWVVENVSQGGFGAVLGTIPGEWLRVGALLAMQPDGGENWLLGIVRRYQRDSETDARVGIQTVARQAVSVELKPRAASSYAAAAGIPGLLVQEGVDSGEALLVLPPVSFDIRESLEYACDGVHYLLSPVALLEQTQDYEMARYRRRRIDQG